MIKLAPRAALPRRLPFAERKRAQRQAARRRLAARTSRPLPPSAPPAPVPRRLEGLAMAAAILLASTALHGALAALGLALRGRGHEVQGPVVQAVSVTVKPPPPPPPAAPPAPAAVAPAPPREAPRPVRARTPPPPPPVAAPVAPAAPTRVVGLSLEATVEGAGGPVFAAGNTREGATAAHALPIAEPSLPPTVAANQVATRLPGARHTLPRRKRASEPPYPPAYRSQGLEADVTVLVTLDGAGKVTAVKVIKPAAFPDFDEAARRAALAEEFEPATRDGVPVPTSLSFTYHFRLESP
jgi:protein TonB